MNNRAKQQEKIYNLALLGLFASLVFILTYYIKIPIGDLNTTLSLVPIIIGGFYLKPYAGAVLGFIFGIIILFTDPTAAFLMTINWFYTFLACVARGLLVGYIPALLYHFMKKRMKNKIIPVSICTIIMPVFNTSIFLAFMFLCFNNVISDWAGASGMMSFLYANVFINMFLEITSAVVVCIPVLIFLEKTRKSMIKK